MHGLYAHMDKRRVLVVQDAVATGAGSVDYLDDNEYRRDLAVRSGSNVDLPTILDERYDLVLSVTYDHESLHRGLLALVPSGHCSCIGIIFKAPKIPQYCATSRSRSDRALCARLLPRCSTSSAAGAALDCLPS